MGCSMARTMVHATPELCTLEKTVYRIMSSWTDGFVPLCQFLLNLQDEWGSVNPEGVPLCFPKLSDGSIRESMSNVRIGCGFKSMASRAFLVGRWIISTLAVGQRRSTLWTLCRKCCSCAAFESTVGGLWMHPRHEQVLVKTCLERLSIPPIDMLSTYRQTLTLLFAVKWWDNWRRRRNWPKMDEPP